MKEIKIQLNGTEVNESGYSLEITWAELLPEIHKIVRLRPSEHVTGLIASPEGLKAVIALKRGPKKQEKKELAESLGTLAEIIDNGNSTIQTPNEIGL